MSRALKVYGWIGFRVEAARPDAPWRNQTREIVAASSMAEVARIAGAKSPRTLWNLCETGNKQEIEVALAKPGAIFWRGLDDYAAQYAEASSGAD